MTGNRKDHIRVWKHKEKEDKVWHYPPLPIGASRAVRHRKGREGGHSGGLKDLETGQVTSRAVPVPGPMADRGTQAATADPGTQAATADPGTQAATADPGTQAATADPGTQAATADPAATEGLGTEEAMAERGARAAMADRGTQAAMEGSPPPKFSWGSSPSQGGAQEPWTAS